MCIRDRFGDAVEALPIKVAVILRAVKSPEPSRVTIAFPEFKFVAVVAEFATLPAAVIVAKYVSTICVPCQTPVEIVPTPVRLEPVTPLPKVEVFSTSVPLI